MKSRRVAIFLIVAIFALPIARAQDSDPGSGDPSSGATVTGQAPSPSQGGTGGSGAPSPQSVPFKGVVLSPTVVTAKSLTKLANIGPMPPVLIPIWLRLFLRFGPPTWPGRAAEVLGEVYAWAARMLPPTALSLNAIFNARNTLVAMESAPASVNPVALQTAVSDAFDGAITALQADLATAANVNTSFTNLDLFEFVGNLTNAEVTVTGPTVTESLQGIFALDPAAVTATLSAAQGAAGAAGVGSLTTAAAETGLLGLVGIASNAVGQLINEQVVNPILFNAPAPPVQLGPFPWNPTNPSVTWNITVDFLTNPTVPEPSITTPPSQRANFAPNFGVLSLLNLSCTYPVKPEVDSPYTPQAGTPFLPIGTACRTAEDLYCQHFKYMEADHSSQYSIALPGQTYTIVQCVPVSEPPQQQEPVTRPTPRVTKPTMELLLRSPFGPSERMH